MHVAIIGNGVAGVTAALRLREKQPDWRITLISGESTYHFSRPALMYVFMGHMRYRDTKPFEDSFWQERALDLVRGWVARIDVEGRMLHLVDGREIHWDELLIATGSKPNRFGWPGQDLEGVQGLWGLPDLERLHDRMPVVRRAVIVGGGLIGIELAEMLASRGVPVTFLVREASYWNGILPKEESLMVGRHIVEHGIDLRLETELDLVVDDGRGGCGGVRTKAGEELACELVGLTAGVSPNVELARTSGIPVGRGVLVDWSLRTQLDGVYAAGDCAELVNEGEARNTIQQVWYTGKMQGEVVADVIAGEERTYDPGIWFNSAKFLDLEYQTYGSVPASVTSDESLYWEHADGKHGLRIVHDAEGDRAVTGFNAMGLRLRHEVCERWLARRAPLREVLADLESANFDPEFFRRHEADIRAAFEGALV